MVNKKVILFIVESANDQIAIANSLECVLSSDNVSFQITDGDITSDKLRKGIKDEVGNIIKQHCIHYKLRPADILETVLLLDLDGVYITLDNIIESADHVKPYYKGDSILHIHPAFLYETHMRKQRNLSILTGVEKVMNIPFSVYFFSCNLDHVICNDANLTQYQKREEAGRFDKLYCEDSRGFISFFTEHGLTSGCSYLNSWQTAREGTNSLKRRSNFNVYLSTEAKSIPRDFSHLLDCTSR